MRDDLNETILEEITKSGWKCTNLDASIGASRTFEKPTEKGHYEVWFCIFNSSIPCWARGERIKGIIGDHSWHISLMDAIKNENPIAILKRGQPIYEKKFTENYYKIIQK